MKKKQLLICNRALLVLFPVEVSGGILLENLHGQPFCGLDMAVWTWWHVLLSIAMVVLVVWHLWLNWNKVGQWYKRLKKHRSKTFQCTAVIFLLTVLTGVAAFTFWLSHGHTGLGGIHGKIGFVCAFLLLWHIVGHRKWYA